MFRTIFKLRFYDMLVKLGMMAIGFVILLFVTWIYFKWAEGSFNKFFDKFKRKK